jgi:hypothetical protein
MGKKKTFVGTQIARVIEDDRLPTSVKKAVTTALYRNGEVVDYVLEELMSSIGVRAERLYDFAERGSYVHGLPSGEFKVPGKNVQPAVKAVLDAIHGASVTMHYAHHAPPNSLHIGWMALLAQHGYDPATNQLGNLTTTKGTPVYLHDMLVVVPHSDLDVVEVKSIQQWGVAPKAGYTPERKTGTPASRALVLHSPVLVDFIPEEVLRVEYVWIENEELQKASFTIPVAAAGYSDNDEFFHASYTVGGQTYYWMYRTGAGTHPSLDNLFDTNTVTVGEFFPFIYFRYGKVSELADKTTESYKDNVKLLKYLGMNFDQVAEGVNQNPDIADVEQAMMMFAVPANTENEQERAYLFQFFNNMFLAQGIGERFRTEAQADIVAAQLRNNDLKAPGIVIQDGRFKMSLNNQGIYKLKKRGNIAAVGKHSSGFATFATNTTLIYIDPLTDIQTEYTVTTPTTYHYYRKQVAKDVYEEIQVVELETRFYVNNEYFVTGDETDKILLIPLDHSITENYSIPDRELLYARSLHYVFNSLQVVKLKWYQTGIFKVIMVIVAVTISIMSGGADGGSVIAAALAAGNIALAAQIIITLIVEYVVMKIAFKLFVKVVGARAAMVIAIVAAFAGINAGIQGGGLSGAPWAKELLSLANGLASAISGQIQADLVGLADDYSEFQKYVDEQMKLLDSAKDLLNTTSYLSPFVIIGETPSEFYNRTVHSGNIGVVSIDAVSSFVDSKLRLPRIDETLGQQFGMEENFG